MPKLVVHGAMMSCDQGAAPASLVVPPLANASADEQALATVNDFQPQVNIPPFGMCRTQANPQVAAATAAANGVPTPQPCVPVTTSPWSPGSSISSLDGVRLLSDDSTCKCAWSGTIRIDAPGSAVDLD
jgi:hypothetical protein